MISICSPQLGLSLESNSGGEVYDREVLTHLTQQNIKIHVLLPRGRTFPQAKNLHIKQTLIRPMIPPYIFNLFVLPYLLKTYFFHKFDLLRVHNPYFVGPAALIFKKLFPKIPLVLSHLHLEDGFNRLIDQATINQYDHIITISNSTKQEIIDNFSYPASKISVAYPGVDKKFQPAKYPKKNKKTTLLFLGGLKPRKNLIFLLKLLKSLNNKNIKLVFAGTGPLLGKLKNKTAELNLQNQVEFLGFIPEKDKVKVYQSADILLLPSLKEGFGMTITEAAACGIPAIGADHYSIKEIIQDNKTGLLAKPNDLNDWKEKTLQLIKSDKLRKQMGAQVQKHVRKTFSWQKNIDIHLKVFKKLTKNK
ncbi:glycosyltransferase family 4 protein [Patescibacteria group bacterium]